MGSPHRGSSLNLRGRGNIKRNFGGGTPHWRPPPQARLPAWEPSPSLPFALFLPFKREIEHRGSPRRGSTSVLSQREQAKGVLEWGFPAGDLDHQRGR